MFSSLLIFCRLTMSNQLTPTMLQSLFDLLCADALPVSLAATYFVSHWLNLCYNSAESVAPTCSGTSALSWLLSAPPANSPASVDASLYRTRFAGLQRLLASPVCHTLCTSFYYDFD
jgi:hypothetical protein